MKKILVGNSSGPSARLIRDSIFEITGQKFIVTKKPEKITDGILFRYGNAVNIPGFDCDFNSRRFICLAGNKLNFSRFCQENDFYSPIFYTRNERPENYPVVIRKTLTGFGGKGIVIVNNEEEFNNNIGNYYWTPFIKCDFELRAHLFGNKVNRIYKKILVGSQEEQFPIRNNSNGYHFSLRNLENYQKVIDLCNALGNKFMEIGGYFSGVDLGWDSVNKRYLIFEINSAPGISSVNAKEYARYFIDTLEIK